MREAGAPPPILMACATDQAPRYRAPLRRMAMPMLGLVAACAGLPAPPAYPEGPPWWRDDGRAGCRHVPYVAGEFYRTYVPVFLDDALDYVGGVCPILIRTEALCPAVESVVNRAGPPAGRYHALGNQDVIELQVVATRGHGPPWRKAERVSSCWAGRSFAVFQVQEASRVAFGRRTWVSSGYWKVPDV
jgi:hypothetical protein